MTTTTRTWMPVAGLCAFALALGAAAWVLVTYAPEASSPQTSEDPSLFHEPTNIQITIPAGWARADSTPVPAPIQSAYFVLKDASSTCAIAYALMSTTDYEQLKQTSFADRVFADADPEQQFDSSWWVFKSSLPAGFEFQWEGKQPMPGEMRITSDFNGYSDAGRNTFILYDTAGGVVADPCDADLSAVLRSFVRRYESATISGSSVGDLRITFAPRNTLLFRDSRTQMLKKVTQFDSTFSDPMVRDNVLYYASGAKVHAYDPFKSTDTIVVDGSAYGNSIHSYLITGNSIWFLIGQDYCDTRCDSVLVEHTAAGTAMLSEHVGASTIDGFDTGEQALYMHGGYGDAGCISEEVTKYGVVSGRVEPVRSFGYCVEEPGWEAQSAALDSYVRRFGISADVTDIHVDHGTLSLGVSTTTVGPYMPIRFIR